jgi:hypothetical protein
MPVKKASKKESIGKKIKRVRADKNVPLERVANETGFSVDYLYAPSNTPDHLWWIRRFTPVVVPGFVLYATDYYFAQKENLLNPAAAEWIEGKYTD